MLKALETNSLKAVNSQTKMKLVLLLSWLAIIQAYVIHNDVITNGVLYKKEILYDIGSTSTRLVVDYSTNDLYLSYKKEGECGIAKINLDTKNFTHIKGVCQCAAVDQDTQDVYLGGIRGIYKYNVSINKAELSGTNGANSIIWNMFFKNVLFFIGLPSNFLYKFVNGHTTRAEEVDRKVDNFVIDNEDVMYYSYYADFYRQSKGSNDTILIKDVPYVRALTTDKMGHVYACSYDGIYKAVGHSAKFRKVIDDVDLNGIAFDRDNNIIYSEGNEIIRLTKKRSVTTTQSSSDTKPSS